METEIIDKLFLELSQITKAKTKREIELEKDVEQLMNIIRIRENMKKWFKDEE